MVFLDHPSLHLKGRGQFIGVLRQRSVQNTEFMHLIDAADSVALEQRYLRTINKEFANICPKRHYVLGNHCVDTLKKEEFRKVLTFLSE